MRYRKMSPSGDYTFGQGSLNYYVNLPETVGQAVLTRLRLFLAEWFLNTLDGTPYQTDVLGTGTKDSFDDAIRNRILGTEGVTSLDNYSSELNPTTRALTISCRIDTIYGVVDFNSTLAYPIPDVFHVVTDTGDRATTDTGGRGIAIG